MYAKCFCAGRETIHHWKNFAPGVTGCCVEFDAKELLKDVDDVASHTSGCLRYGWVDYEYTKFVTAKQPDLPRYPFVKRKPYHVENEYRIIWQGADYDAPREIPFRLECIKKITLSPELPRNIFEAIEPLLRELLKGTASSAQINLSKMLEHPEWIAAFRR